MDKFPKIRCFHSVYLNVKSRSEFLKQDMPKLDFVGTVKLNGANSSISYLNDGSINTHSRNRTLTVGSDNLGFASFIFKDTTRKYWKNFFESIKEIFDAKDLPITIYGEWCGKGISDGFAISKLPKMFVIFAIKIGSEYSSRWLSPKELCSIPDIVYNKDKSIKMIYDFSIYEMSIDFSDPQRYVDELNELTRKVSLSCPIGHKLGVSGFGEGIIWRCTSDGFDGLNYWFKTKDVKYKATITKNPAQIDVDKKNTIRDFVTATLTKNRINQGIEYLNENKTHLSIRNSKEFVRWIVNDILDEECDMLTKSSLSKDDVIIALSQKAEAEYIKYLDRL